MSHGRMHDKPRASPANREDQVMADLDAALPWNEPLTLAQRRRVREAIRAAAAQPGERERADALRHRPGCLADGPCLCPSDTAIRAAIGAADKSARGGSGCYDDISDILAAAYAVDFRLRAAAAQPGELERENPSVRWTQQALAEHRRSRSAPYMHVPVEVVEGLLRAAALPGQPSGAAPQEEKT